MHVNRWSRKRALALLVAFALLGPSSPARAIRVEFGLGGATPATIWQLSGTITGAGESIVPGQFAPPEAPEVAAALAALGVAAGVHWTGQLTFIPNAIGFQSSSDPHVVDFPGASVLLSVGAGGLFAETPDGPGGALELALFGPVDGNTLVATAPMAGAGASSARLSLVSFDAGAFGFASGLPQHSRDLPALAEASRVALLGSVLVANPNPSGPVLISAPFEIDGSLGSIVPEPAAALFAALAALAALRGRRP